MRAGSRAGPRPRMPGRRWDGAFQLRPYSVQAKSKSKSRTASSCRLMQLPLKQWAGDTAGSGSAVGMHCSSKRQPGTGTWRPLEWNVEWLEMGTCSMGNGNQQNLGHSPTPQTHPSSPKRLVCFEGGLGSQPTSLCVITNSGSARCHIECPRPSPCAIIHVDPLLSSDSTECCGTTWRWMALRRPGAFPRRPCQRRRQSSPAMHV